MYTWISSCPPTLDLTDAADLAKVMALADTVLASYGACAPLADLEDELITQKEEIPLMAHVAVKLARAKCLLHAIDEPLHISVVFAMYKEQNRILTKAEHPNGEDFLMRKIEQMQWLCADHPTVEWDLYAVDDGCPEGSGHIAQEILQQRYEGDNAHVLFLKDAIVEGLPVTHPMTQTSDSQKGGSIAYGMWYAAQQYCEGAHVVVYTDADLSTHLGQIGLLVDPLLNKGQAVAIGSRREPHSVVIKQGARNNRGKLFIYLWKRMLPALNYIVDTQCGFKAFRLDTLQEIIMPLLEKRFAFDIELLLKAELLQDSSIERVPVAWIDSDAESTTTDIQPYLPMLQAIAGMYRTYLPAEPQADAFAAFIEQLSEVAWQQVLGHIPDAIATQDPQVFGTYAGVTVADLEQLITT